MTTAMTIVYVPTWAGVIEGWTRKTSNQLAWRTDPDFSFDDLLQEAWIVFNRCADRWRRAWITGEDKAALVQER